MSDHTLNLLSLVNQQGVATPENFLQLALPKIVAQLRDAYAAAVYRLAQGGLILWDQVGNAGHTKSFTTLDADSPYQKAIITGLVGYGTTKNSIIAPLKGQNEQVFALLEINHHAEAVIDRVNEVAAQFGYALYSKHLEHLFQIQLVATAQMNQASTADDLVGVLAKNLAKPGQFVAFNIFTYDANHHLTGAQTLTTANRNQTFEPSEAINVQLNYLQLLHEEFRLTGDILISNTQTDHRLNQSARDWLKSRNIHSLYGVALSIQDTLYGFITYIDSVNAQALTSEEKQLYTNLAQQAGAIIEKRELLDQTAASLNATQVLYDLVGSLMQANTIPRILEILHQAIGEGTRNIAFSEFSYSDGDPDQITDVRIRYVITRDQAHAVDVPWFEDMQPEETANAFEFMQKVGDDLEILEDYEQNKKDLWILAKLQEQGINSSITIPLIENGRRVQQVTLTWREAQVFDSRLLQILRTAKSQIALVLQNQDLLESVQQSVTSSEENAARLQRIADFGQALQTSLVLSEILNHVLGYSWQILNADYVAVMTYDRTMDALRNVGQFRDGKAIITNPGELVEKGSNTIAGKAWASKDVVAIGQLQSSWEDQHPLLTELQSILAAPLISGGVVLGILEIGSRKANQYHEADLVAFRQMSNQIAAALTNADTYAQSQKLALNKGIANEIIAKLQRQPDVDSILQVTAQELGRALGAKRVRIRLGLDAGGSAGE